MSSYRPSVMWRRVALWSNSSWWARALFWGGCIGGAWAAGTYTMSATNKYSYDPELMRELEAKKSTEQHVQTDLARDQLQRLLDDIKSGKDQQRDWKPR